MRWLITTPTDIIFVLKPNHAISEVLPIKLKILLKVAAIYKTLGNALFSCSFQIHKFNKLAPWWCNVSPI